MKRSWLLASTLLAASCVSQPEAPVARVQPEAPVAQAEKAKRTEEYAVAVVVGETVSYADGVVERVVTYAYEDDYSRLVSTVARKPSSSIPLERVEYEYSGDALAAKSTYGPDGSLSSRSLYTYGSSGELVRESIEDGAGAIRSVSEWSWDGGRKSSWRVLSAAGLVLAKTDYSYDGDDLVAANMLDGAGNPKGRIAYTYLAGSGLARVEYFDAKGARDGTIEYARENGLLMREAVYRADGRLERRLSYEYSPDGALIKKTLADSAGRPREIVEYQNAYRTETRIVNDE